MKEYNLKVSIDEILLIQRRYNVPLDDAASYILAERYIDDQPDDHNWSDWINYFASLRKMKL